MSSSPNPIFAYVRIQKIYIPDAPPTRLTIYQAIRPDDSGIYAPLARLKEADMFGCATVLVLRTLPTRFTQLSFVISEFRPEVGDVEYARLILPLVWFRPNRVVSYTYPFITRVAVEQPPMALIDVHLSHGSTGPFACPLAALKVEPTWTIPDCIKPPEVQPVERKAPPGAPGLEQEEDGVPRVRATTPSVIPPEVDSWLEANREAVPE
jgi:hypothetical protein